MVHWPCFTCGWKETRDPDHSSKLCCKLWRCFWHLHIMLLVFAITYKSWIFCLCPYFLVQVLSIACCVFYSHCGNRAILRQRPLERKPSNWFSLFKKQERNTWLAKFLRMNELKDQVCLSWFAPVGSASDYPLLSKWVIYGEVHLASTISFIQKFPPIFVCNFVSSISQLACSGSCPGSSDGISPIYSLWATFIGLYIANYVVERSTGLVAYLQLILLFAYCCWLFSLDISRIYRWVHFLGSMGFDVKASLLCLLINRNYWTEHFLLLLLLC